MPEAKLTLNLRHSPNPGYPLITTNRSFNRTSSSLELMIVHNGMKQYISMTRPKSRHSLRNTENYQE
ncbi:MULTISPECIES: hypothetical protein [unclassified Legionella]|uniref:hypothetical protein n=1 Tax=unclassified Legionella TaxID=2622702 RepID=UPI001056018D|nr:MULTISPECIES: hypothetical protein [unclassified Legionella]MDI9819046.1 hypothetical protein [Legionella sp. PL877]